MENFQSGISGDIFIEQMTGLTAPQPVIMHYHNFYELYFLVEGNRDYIIDGEVFNLTDDCVALIRPGCLHKTVGGAYKRILVQFRENLLRGYFTRALSEKMLECFNRCYIRVPQSELANIRFLFLRLLKDQNSQSAEMTVMHLGELLILLNKSVSECDQQKHTPKFSDERMGAVLKYIGDNYAELDTLSQIADHFYLNKYHLCHIFKETTGLSIISYLNNVKISHALKMLTETDRSVTQIAQDCGFNSPVHFCNTFKKSVRLSPKEYRAQVKLQKRSLK